MSDLISRQDAIEALRKHEIELPLYAPRETDVFWDDAIDCCITELEDLPSAESQIIRCKDCKWWERTAEDSPMGYCHACKHGHYSRHWEIHIIRTYEEDFFCADAELKEEEEEE